MNFLQTYRMDELIVAENIITYLLCGVFLKIVYISPLMSLINKNIIIYKENKCKNCLPSDSSILSHSSRIKIFKLSRIRNFLVIKSRVRPGVPTITVGGLVRISFVC